MKVLPWFLLVLIPCAFSITIREIVVEGDAGDEDRPLEEGNEVSLKCRADSEWSVCIWYHEIEDQKDQNGNNLHYSCSLSASQGSTTCDNNGGSDELDNSASRIRLDASGDTCGLRISKSEAEDSGKWACTMMDAANAQAPAYADTNGKGPFVSNQSTIFITEPDLWQNPNDVITYEIDNDREEIEATCTAYGGNPDPEFHWYVGDDRNEITQDLDRRQIKSSDDLGAFVSEQMTWQPSRDDLCQFDATERFCRDEAFSFNLLCKVVQQAGSKVYYQTPNDQQEIEVVVEVKSGSPIKSMSTILLLCLISTSIMFQ